MNKSNTTRILTVKDQIAEQIRADIFSGDLKPNTKLKETELAERFGLSRGPIRDVILQLTKEGLLVSKNNKGASVNSVLEPKMQQLIIQLRREIEVFCIEELQGKMQAKHFQELEELLEDLQQAFEEEDYTQVTKIDIDFHNYLIYLAGGEELVNIWYPYVMRMRLNYKRINKSQDSVTEHKRIIDALKEGDLKKASKAIKENIK